jgi:hypothetical protein
LIAGLLHLGKFIRLVPYPVMLGFVNGLAIVIFLSQLGQFRIADENGTRHWSEGGAPRTLSYRERVSADGTGRVSLELLDLLSPTGTEAQQDLFELLHQARQGFVHRYRDFRVHDVELFFENYLVHDQGNIVQLAGHACADLDIRRADGSGSVWRVAVELSSGLPLRVREQGPAGELLSLSEFESLDLDPDLGGVAFHEPVRDEQPLAASLTGATAQLGFEPVVPNLVPEGWRLIAAALVEDPTEPQRPWAKYTYSDGLGAVVYMHGGHLGPQAQLALAQGTPSGDVVQHLAIASWNALQGRVKQQRVLAVGKAPQDLLLSLIQSAFY